MSTLSRTVLHFLDAPEPCRKCGQPCLTRKFGGRVPLHIGCDSRAYVEDPPTAFELAELVYDIAEALGPLSFDPPAPPPRPRDYGPCRLCSRWHVLYGEWGHPLCKPCRSAKEAL